jgi:hypothetical protein
MPPILERRDYGWQSEDCLVERSDAGPWELAGAYYWDLSRDQLRHHTLSRTGFDGGLVIWLVGR